MISPKQLADFGWERTNPGAPSIMAIWLHKDSGWWIQHCGHATANYPLQLFNPATGTMVLAPNGRAFKDLPAAIGHHAQVLRGVQEPLPIQNLVDLFNEKMAAQQQATVDELNRILRTPLADVSKDAGQMERNSPLFFGKGENPTLF